jgi:N-acyl-phosphatidylethanolamine-hydrolysing phospholipase D
MIERRRFSNPWPHEEHGLSDILRWKLAGIRKPKVPLGETPWQAMKLDVLSAPPQDQWRCWWLGHAGFLLQGNSLNLLIDPVFGDYCSPVPIRSLKRCNPPPCQLEDFPPIDAIFLTHSHYDHLCLETLRRIAGDPEIFLPEGHAAWIKKNTRFRKIHELPWWASMPWIDGLTITAVPAQHFTARSPFDRNRGHWCGWVIGTPHARIWHAGDSGYCSVFREIGDFFPSIDLAMIPIGAYEPRKIMKAMHMNPEDAVQAFIDARCRKAIGMHWGTFQLTDEPTNEPPQRLELALSQQGITREKFLTLPIGGWVDVEKTPRL